MNTAVLPVKRPAGSLSRLSGLLSPPEREELAWKLYRRALNVLGAVSAINELIVVSTDPDVLDVARGAGAQVVEETEQISHSHSAELGVAMALRLGASTVLSAAIDVPLASSAEYEELLGASAHLSPRGLIIVPSFDGTGTNALLRTPPDLMVSSFGPGSFVRHQDAGSRAGAQVRTMRPAGIVLDLDTPEDLLAIEEQATDDNDVLTLLRTMDAFNRARAIVGQLHRTGV